MSRNDGSKFENALKTFLAMLINELFNKKDKGFLLTCEPTIQQHGTQNGRDITVEWIYDSMEYRWWFECKDYKRIIPKNSYADKILETLLKIKQPVCFCLVGTFFGPCNWFRQIKDDFDRQTFKRPNLFFWPIEGQNGFKQALRCYPSVFEKIYKQEKRYPEDEAREAILISVKNFIILQNEEGRKRLQEQILLPVQSFIDPKHEENNFVSKEVIDDIESISKQLKQLP
jgi:hypothetical protein